MTSISIIGTGTMARILATRALARDNTVQVIGRDRAKAADLASALGGATAGTIGTAPAGDIVILAAPAPRRSSASTATRWPARVIVDTTNPFNPGATGLAIPDGTSIAQEVAKAAPAGAQVVKAFNTIFGNVLAQGRLLDVFIAGDDAQAKASISAFIESLGLRALDTGDRTMAHWLEGSGPAPPTRTAFAGGRAPVLAHSQSPSPTDRRSDARLAPAANEPK
jgi:8-hydroxy-5-deazaflavin:NADPH oxidoreductase